MLTFLKEKFNTLKTLLEEATKGDQQQNQKEPVSLDLLKNTAYIKKTFGQSTDLVVRELHAHGSNQQRMAIAYLDSLTDGKDVNDYVLRPLMVYGPQLHADRHRAGMLPKYLQENVLTIGEVETAEDMESVLDGILTGNTILFVHGAHEALVMSTRGGEARSIEEPTSEVSIRGAKDSFNEVLRTNLTLLRRRLHTPKLHMELLRVGDKTRTKVCVAYVDGVCNPRMVKEVKRRLERIKTDAVLSFGYVQDFITDAPFSPFTTMGTSERPDVVAAKLLEGRIGIIVDGNPLVITVPYLWIEIFQNIDDYNFLPLYATSIRMLRYLAFAISILAPAVYVAVVTFHHEFIPTVMIFGLAASREGTPFPAVLEALGMGAVFEILREAGLRMPRPVGQAVSIVGALVIGEAAVQAGLVGAAMVIVVALTAISSFVVPETADIGSLLRLFFVVLAGMTGAFGITVGLLMILVHMASLRSFGVPYLSPLAPLSPGDLKDAVVRAPMWAMFTRPRAIGWRDPQRQDFRLMPHPPDRDADTENDEGVESDADEE